MNTVSNLVVGKYELIESLGEGAFGKTYLAQDQQGNKYAVKKFIFFSSNSREMAIAKRKFNDEVKSLQKLNHPQIPQFVEYIEEEQEFYLVQQYINGKTLREKLHIHGKISLQAAHQILIDLLKIIDYLHQQNIIHRDIKPDNIMINDQGNLFLIDFGAVKEIISHATKLQIKATRIHTPGYAPIEQIHGEPQFNSDIYALGMTIIELMTGLKPDHFSDPWYRDISLSDNLRDILCKMIDEDYHTRYKSAADVIQDLEKQNSAKTIPIIPIIPTPDIDPESVNEMIWFVLLFILIFLSIFHTFMLPTFKNKEHEEQQSLSTNNKIPDFFYDRVNKL
ncbi:serine/threonine-protein kinase [Okeanomitos corallinicola TIOX110]|uniref:non-specific serine/threonine protein kinase n=1 Tax=Okeanomitos corallinicola TIOX110 TaxID=3133117 RepID=A0ABZ2URW6_9CYAN